MWGKSLWESPANSSYVSVDFWWHVHNPKSEMQNLLSAFCLQTEQRNRYGYSYDSAKVLTRCHFQANMKIKGSDLGIAHVEFTMYSKR